MAPGFGAIRCEADQIFHLWGIEIDSSAYLQIQIGFSTYEDRFLTLCVSSGDELAVVYLLLPVAIGQPHFGLVLWTLQRRPEPICHEVEGVMNNGLPKMDKPIYAGFKGSGGHTACDGESHFHIFCSATLKYDLESAREAQGKRSTRDYKRS